MQLDYVVFDLGARSSRIEQAKAELLAANLAFNDAHRQIIYRVQAAYYRLLNDLGQEQAVNTSLENAKTVQQAAETRLENGLSTQPDVLEAQSATAQAEYDLQATLGADQIARGDLATSLGIPASTRLQVQPLDQVPEPATLDDTVDEALNRALRQRPDLLEKLAQVRSSYATVKESKASFYPSLSVDVAPAAQSLYGKQQAFDWVHSGGLNGSVTLSLKWTLFDGGARRSRLAQAHAESRSAEAQVSAKRDQVDNQIWTAYANLKTAIRQRQSALTLLAAASESYSSALEAFNSGVRSLLDVTAAQRVLAQARSTNVLARTQVLTTMAALAFETADAISSTSERAKP